MSSRQRQALQQQLDELQDQYFSSGQAARASTAEGGLQGRAADKAPTRAELALQRIKEASAAPPGFARHQSETADRKEGLDLSLHHLCSDASRMRSNLQEVSLALGEAGRRREAARVAQLAVPREVVATFQEQQRVLVEQRRQLAELRQDRQAAEDEQLQLRREHRQHWRSGNRKAAVSPGDVVEMQSQLRQEARMSEALTTATALAEGYLLAEILSVKGLTADELWETELEVAVRRPGGQAVVTSKVEGPMETDGGMAPRRVQLTIPAEVFQKGVDLNVEIKLIGLNASASGSVPLSQISEHRAGASWMQLSPAGAWDTGGAKPRAEVSLTATRPVDGAGWTLAHTRVVGDAHQAPRSRFPGRELPPSQAHLRRRMLDWDRMGRPSSHDELADRAEVPARPSEGAPSQAPAAAPAALPAPQATRATPASQLDEQPEMEASPSSMFNFFAGFAERGGDAGPGRGRSPGQPRRGPPSARAQSLGEEGGPAGLGGRPLVAAASTPREGLPRTAVQKNSGGPQGRAGAAGVPFDASVSWDGAPSRGDAIGLSDSMPLFAAFAGFGDASEGDADGRPAAAERLSLRPPSREGSLDALCGELKSEVQMGRLGQPEVAQTVLEFAATLAYLREDGKDGELNATQLSGYAAILLDAMEKYKASDVLTLWMVEALLAIYVAPGAAEQRVRLAGPLFSALADAALRCAKVPDPAMHRRFLEGLAAVATPDCGVLSSCALVDYVCDQLESALETLTPLMAEHGLSVLCVLRSPRRCKDQVRLTLHVLSSMKSDVHLVVRALVTLAELYGLLSEGGPHGEPAAAQLPADGADVRLVTMVLDLNPEHRKVCGAAARAYAAMAAISPAHVRLIAAEARRLLRTQALHANSRSVALHVSELVCAAARIDASLVTEPAVRLACQALLSHPRDPSVAACATEALQRCAALGHVYLVLDLLPLPELVTVGELHRANPEVILPVCQLLDALAGAGRDAVADLVEAAAAVVPVRALEVASQRPETVVVAVRCLKRLLCRSRDAPRHVVRTGGAVLLFHAIMAHGQSPEVVRTGLSTLAVCAQDRDARLQLIDPLSSDSWTVLDALLRVVGDTVEQDPDILAQFCCCVGALTSAEISHQEASMRRYIEPEALKEVVDRAAAAHPAFTGGMGYCRRCIDRGEETDLRAERLLAPSGAEQQKLLSRRGRAFQASVDAEEEVCRAKKAEYDAKKGGKPPGVGVDAFAPLRGLRVARKKKAAGTEVMDDSMQEDYVPKDSKRAAADDGGGIFGGLFGGGQPDDAVVPLPEPGIPATFM